MSYTITSKIQEPVKAMYFDEITQLTVRRAPVLKDPELSSDREPYLVSLNYMNNIVFQYNPTEWNIYLDEPDQDTMQEMLDKDIELAKQMEIDGISEDEIKKEFKDKGNEYYLRQKYNVLTGDLHAPVNLVSIVQNIITTQGI